MFTFSVKLEKWSFHVADLPRTGKKCTEMKKAREGRAKLLFCFTLAKCVLTVLELNQRFRDKKTKLNICHHVLMSSTQLQNRSFHVWERTRTSSKCPKKEKWTCKACKACKACKTICYANLCGFCCRRRRGCLSSPLLPR